ncbi:MAG: rhodanese-like domain-containing protein [Vicinamibacterales bacterium]
MGHMVAVRQISAPDLRKMLESDARPLVVDVRTEHERALASLEPTVLLTKETYQQLLLRERNSPLVFMCHHGIRSQAAAEHFLQQGFQQVFNLSGGIDAWSQLVDPSVPRY